MSKTLTFCLLAALAIAVSIPGAAGSLNARSSYGAAALDFGNGLGLYDPGSSASCLALVAVGTGALPYYALPTRYWPAVAAGAPPFNVGLSIPDPTNCTGLVPGDFLNVDSVQAEAGTVAYVDALLAPTQVALGSPDLTLLYDTGPGCSSTAGPPYLTVGPVSLFQADNAACNPYGSYQASALCPDLTWTSVAGSIRLDQPIYLADTQAPGGSGSCNGLVGSDNPGLASQVDTLTTVCLSAPLFDSATGTFSYESDSDFFVAARDGSMASFANDPGTSTALFPNVANMNGDSPRSDCSTTGTLPGGRCNGLVDLNCSYCSDNGGNFGQEWRRCIEQQPGYFWEGCTVWVDNRCIVG